MFLEPVRSNMDISSTEADSDSTSADSPSDASARSSSSSDDDSIDEKPTDSVEKFEQALDDAHGHVAGKPFDTIIEKDGYNHTHDTRVRCEIDDRDFDAIYTRIIDGLSDRGWRVCRVEFEYGTIDFAYVGE